MAAVLVGAFVLAGTWPTLAHADPYADGVWAFVPGTDAGFGQDLLPDVVTGPPEGAGATAGSSDVVSLGDGGMIVLVFRDNVVFDGPGDDLVVYENAFHIGSPDGPIFTEYAYVQVSADGRHFFDVPHDAATFEGLAGQTPVYANSSNGIDPLSAEGGGDRFDIAQTGLSFVRYVRLLDVGSDIDDIGNHVIPAGKAGFDLDAAAALHSVDPVTVLGVVRHLGEPVRRAHVTLEPQGDGKRARARSRRNGGFRMRRVIPSGGYVLRAVRRGVGAAEKLVDVEPGASIVMVAIDIP